MERLILTVIIIAAVLYLFNRSQVGGSQVGTDGTGGSRIVGPGNASSALPPGYRSSPGS
jgi:hypothetical protein